jgi:hypothetical protein
MRTALAKIVGSGREWLRLARLLLVISILSGLVVSSALAVDDTVKPMPDGSKVECSESGQYCLCSGGQNSAACKEVKANCAPGSEFSCEGPWCGCNVPSNAKVSGGTKRAPGVPAGAEKLVDRFKRNK